MRRLFLLLFIAALPASAYSNSVQQLQNELNDQNYASAASTGLTLLRQQPDNVRIQFLAALAFQHNNQPLLAKRYYQQIIESHPELPEPRNNLAMIYLKQGQHDLAVDLLITSLKTHPAYATAWQNLSNLYRGLASEAYRKALSEENDTRSVAHQIQLTALTRLHSLPQTSVDTTSMTTEVEKAIPHNISPAPATLETSVNQNTPDNNAELVTIVKNWAADWSQKNLESYISAYTNNYKGKKASHEDWVKHRQERLEKHGRINVALTKIRIQSSTQDRVIIDFEQSFKSPGYSDRVVKRLHLDKIDDSWKINQESTLAVL